MTYAHEKWKRRRRSLSTLAVAAALLSVVASIVALILAHRMETTNVLVVWWYYGAFAVYGGVGALSFVVASVAALTFHAAREPVDGDNQ